ncbi:MAG: molybdopterin-dependent oxidoreductase [Candidatus Bathyarchaeia archaeon]
MEVPEKLSGAKVSKSICGVCPFRCSIEAYVKDGRLVYTRGNTENPNTRGKRCVKGFASIWFAYDPDRLKYPLMRVSERGEGKFKRISWDEAFTIIAEKLKEIKEKYGPEAVVSLDHVQGCTWHYKNFLYLLYGTPNIYDHTAACDGTFTTACITLFGAFWGIEDYENSKYILIWGKEPFEAPRIVGFLQGLMEAKDRGAKLVVVNPRLSKTAEKADEWIPIRPGTDGAMALAMAKTIIDEELYDREFIEKYCYGFDEFRGHLEEKGYTPEWAEGITGVPASTIRRIAREFAATKPAVSSAYHGFACYTNAFDAMRAILLLNVLTGNVDKPGSFLLTGSPNGLEPPLKPPFKVPEDKIAKISKPSLREALGFYLAPDFPTALLPKIILEGKPYPIRALILSQVNPIMSDANTKIWIEAFKSLDFAVVIDIYLSETAMYCDIVLPDACYFERYDILQGFNHAPMVLYSEPALSPPGEAKPIYEIVKGIAEKMGYGEYFNWKSEEDWMKNMIEGLPFTLEELKQRGFWLGEPQYRKYESGLKTPTGKIEIYSVLMEAAGYNPLPEYKPPAIIPDEKYPLRLISARMPFQSNVVTQNIPMLADIEGENWAEINPRDAEKYGIKSGDYMVIESPLDSVTVKAKVTEGIVPGVIALVHGFGFGHWGMGKVAKGRGAHINKLVDTYVDPISGTIAYNECKVRVRKA